MLLCYYNGGSLKGVVQYHSIFDPLNISEESEFPRFAKSLNLCIAVRTTKM